MVNATPGDSSPERLRGLRDVLRGKVLVDIANATRRGASCPEGGSSPALKDLIRRASLTEYPVLIFAGFIAAFWGAPLLSQEFEHRTHLWAWTQDISATRWLTTRILGLIAVITVLTSALGLAGTAAVRELHSMDSSAFPPFTSISFDLWPPLQVAYALFGFALGVAVSAISRRTVISMLVTLLGFAAVRVFVAEYLRPHYLTPMRIGTPLGQRAADVGGEGLTVGAGYLHTSGETGRSPGRSSRAAGPRPIRSPAPPPPTPSIRPRCTPALASVAGPRPTSTTSPPTGCCRSSTSRPGSSSGWPSCCWRRHCGWCTG
ncbi:hypothetical protein [Crossiella sp. CA198]|uniref:ABC transporter permease n=1 Tax=Crossiella sp. CA198 TaxID=3455607 RepID=UPI003F8D66E2